MWSQSDTHHGITNWFGLEGTPKIKYHYLAMGRNILLRTRPLQAPPNPAMNTSKGQPQLLWEHLCRASRPPQGTIPPQHIPSNLLSGRGKPFPPALALHALVQSLFSALLKSGALRCPWNLLFLRLNTSSSLSLSPGQAPAFEHLWPPLDSF